MELGFSLFLRESEGVTLTTSNIEPGSSPSLCFLRFASNRLLIPSSEKPTWRNWQTRWTQNPVHASECGFDPLRRQMLPHQPPTRLRIVLRAPSLHIHSDRFQNPFIVVPRTVHTWTYRPSFHPVGRKWNQDFFPRLTR